MRADGEADNGPRPGWLARQMQKTQAEAARWPAWKREAAQSDDARRTRNNGQAPALPRMRRYGGGIA